MSPPEAVPQWELLLFGRRTLLSLELMGLFALAPEVELQAGLGMGPIGHGLIRGHVSDRSTVSRNAYVCHSPKLRRRIKL